MQYKFVQNREDYEKYAAGGVLFAAPGHTAFPIRLSNEIFERCMAFRESEGESRSCILYDPCCGSAYHLTTLAYFNWNKIQRIIGSDINPEALSLAARNLSLLKLEGIDKRIEELSSMLQQFGKESHATSSKNAVILRQELSGFIENHTIETHLFRADATDSAAVSAGLSGIKVDVVITDIPYGQHSHWQFDSRISASTPEPVHQMLDSLLSVLSSKAIVAIAAAKNGRIAHERYEQLKKVKTGKRQVVFLKPSL